MTYPKRFIKVLLALSLSLFGVHAQEEGLASYYHKRFQGKMSSSGQIHNSDELIAAHRTHPFGTFLRVTNLSNLKSVIVCVTDRGPRQKKRVVDVSYAAAELLGFIQKGIAKVRVEVVPNSVMMNLSELITPEMPFLDVRKYKTDIPFRMDYLNN